MLFKKNLTLLYVIITGCSITEIAKAADIGINFGTTQHTGFTGPANDVMGSLSGYNIGIRALAPVATNNSVTYLVGGGTRYMLTNGNITPQAATAITGKYKGGTIPSASIYTEFSSLFLQGNVGVQYKSSPFMAYALFNSGVAIRDHLQFGQAGFYYPYTPYVSHHYYWGFTVGAAYDVGTSSNLGLEFTCNRNGMTIANNIGSGTTGSIDPTAAGDLTTQFNEISANIVYTFSL